jgi:hypothetical protein
VAADGLEPGPRDGLAQHVDVQALELVGDRSGAGTPEPGDERLLGQREDLAQRAPLMASDLDRAGQPRDEPRPRETGRAGRRGAHAANPLPAVSWR